jgi:hypothetical protein
MSDSYDQVSNCGGTTMSNTNKENRVIFVPRGWCCDFNQRQYIVTPMLNLRWKHLPSTDSKLEQLTLVLRYRFMPFELAKLAIILGKRRCESAERLLWRSGKTHACTGRDLGVCFGQEVQGLMQEKVD